MLSVREAWQKLADEADVQGDRIPAESETPTETETGTCTAAADGDSSSDLLSHARQAHQDGTSSKEASSESPKAEGDCGDAYNDDEGDDGKSNVSGDHVEEMPAGESGNDVVGDGVPVSICCSEDGRTVVVVVSG